MMEAVVRKLTLKFVRIALVLALVAAMAGCGTADEPAATSATCKRGLASNQAPGSELGAGLGFWYNWSPSTDAAAPEFVPMVWGDDFDESALVAAIPAGARYLLGFNEPNFYAQANLSASEAAALWPRVEAIAAERNLALVSPAVNFCGDDANKTGPCHETNPAQYLRDFFAACAGCKVDYVAVHWYNCDAPSLSWYLGQFEEFGRPLWLTELACAVGSDHSAAAQDRYARAAVPFLEQHPDVFRYAWFSADPIPEAKLQTPSGELTPLGQTYVELAGGESCSP